MAARLNKGIRDTDVEVYRGTRRLFVLGHVQALEAGLHVPNFLDELFVIYEGVYDLAPDNKTRHLIWPELPQFPRLKVAFSLENHVEVFSFDHQSTEHFRYGPICAGKPILPTPGSPPLEGDELWPDVEDPDIHCREVANLAGAWPCDDLWEWFFVTNAATQLSALRSVHH